MATGGGEKGSYAPSPADRQCALRPTQEALQVAKMQQQGGVSASSLFDSAPLRAAASLSHGPVLPNPTDRSFARGRTVARPEQPATPMAQAPGPRGSRGAHVV